jgi:hypothetical protein
VRPRSRLRIVALAFVLVLATGCRMQVQVGVDVKEDGSGTVSVGVGLDADAVHKLGGVTQLRQLVKVDDLRSAGWKVTGPAQEADGLTWLRASKPFSDPEEAGKVLAEVAGGPFRDFSLARTRAFARTSFEFNGTVDFTKGLESFSDPELTAALDGQPLGQDPDAIAQQLGGSLDRLITVRVAVRLPGSVTSNAPAKAANGAVWQPKLSDTEPSHLHATSRSWRKGTLVLTGAAILAGLAFLVLLVVQTALLLRRRHRRRAAPAEA